MSELDDLVRRVVREELAQLTAANDVDWIDQSRSPLGKRKHLALCRSGVLKARKDGRQRLVRRAELDAYLEARRIEPSAADDPIAEILQARK